MDYDVIIIGGGPAGLTAAVYTARARLKTLVLESLTIPGQAIITDCIENFPGFPEGISGYDFLEKLKKQAGEFGAEIKTGHVTKIVFYNKGWKVEADGKNYTSLSIIVAAGASPKKLGVPGEQKFTGKGVSYCATCDAAFFKDKVVIVVGGGNTAAEEALFLTRFASKVMLVHRKDRLRAAKVLEERVLSNKKIECIWESKVTEIIGDNKVSAVKIENMKTSKAQELRCDGIFIFVGYAPNTGFVKGVLELDDKDAIVTDEDMKTEKEGIFACGDCRRKLLRQMITACGDGATAAFSAQQYVEELKGIVYK